MSIIRVGLAETKKFSEGYAEIFGSKKKTGEKAAGTKGDKKPGKKGKKKKK